MRFWRSTCRIAAGLLAASAVCAEEDVFRLTERKDGNGVVFAGENTHPCAPYHAVVSFPELRNYAASVKLPARIVLGPGERRELFRLDPVEGARRMSYRLSVVYRMGDPRAEPDAGHLYLLPFEHGTKRVVDQGYMGRTTHQDSYALDFDMEEGTKVCASRGGVVIAVKEDSNTGGPSAKYNAHANYVHILHSDGTWAAYAHLKRGGALVDLGEAVSAGQVIGLSGNTGRSSGPHLHFVVNRATWGKEQTLPTAFLGKDGEAVSVSEGRWYYSYHPGGFEFEAVLGETLVEADLEKHLKKIRSDGKLSFRTENVDSRTLIYCRNGTKVAQSVTVKFRKLRGLVSSKRVPHRMTVPPGTEAYVMMLTPKQNTGRREYELAASSRPL